MDNDRSRQGSENCRSMERMKRDRRSSTEQWKRHAAAHCKGRPMRTLWEHSQINWLKRSLYPMPQIRASRNAFPRTRPPMAVAQAQPVEGKREVCPTIAILRHPSVILHPHSESTRLASRRCWCSLGPPRARLNNSNKQRLLLQR